MRVRGKSWLADNSEQHTPAFKVNHTKLKLNSVNKVLELCKVWMIFLIVYNLNPYQMQTYPIAFRELHWLWPIISPRQLMRKEMFALVDQKHQHTKTSLPSFQQQLNLTTNFFPRPAVPNPLANANLNWGPASPNMPLSKLSLLIPSCVVFANQNLWYFRGSKHSD